MSKTPETDEMSVPMLGAETSDDFVPTTFARTLETQRDEARAREQNLLDTFQAIYDRLGIKEGDVPGGEKVSITVKRYVDEARAEAERLRKALGKAQEKWTSFIASARQVRSIGGQTLGSEGYRLEFIGNALAIVEDAFAEALDIPPTETVIPVSSTQPEIFEAHGREWYGHDGGPCPCDLEMKICVCLDNDSCTYAGVKAKRWDWRPCNSGKILGWRPADAPEKLPRK